MGSEMCIRDRLTWRLDFNDNSQGSLSPQWIVEGPDGRVLPHSELIKKHYSIDLSELASDWLGATSVAEGCLHISDLLSQESRPSKSLEKARDLLLSSDRTPEIPENMPDPKELPERAFHPSLTMDQNPDRSLDKQTVLDSMDSLTESQKDTLTNDLQGLIALRDGVQEASQDASGSSATSLETALSHAFGKIDSEQLLLALICKATGRTRDSADLAELANKFKATVKDNQSNHKAKQALSQVLSRKVAPPQQPNVGGWPPELRTLFESGALSPFGSLQFITDETEYNTKETYLAFKGELKYGLLNLSDHFWSELPPNKDGSPRVLSEDPDVRASECQALLLHHIKQNFDSRKQHAGVWAYEEAPPHISLSGWPGPPDQSDLAHNPANPAGQGAPRRGFSRGKIGADPDAYHRFLSPDEFLMYRQLEAFTWPMGKVTINAHAHYAKLLYSEDELFHQRCNGKRPWFEDVYCSHFALARESASDYSDSTVLTTGRWRRKVHAVTLVTLINQHQHKMTFAQILDLWDTMPFDSLPHSRGPNQQIRAIHKEKRREIVDGDASGSLNRLLDSVGESRTLSPSQYYGAIKFLGKFMASQALTPAVAPASWQTFPVQEIVDSDEVLRMRVLHDYQLFPDWEVAVKCVHDSGNPDLAETLRGITDGTMIVWHHWHCNRDNHWTCYVTDHGEYSKIMMSLWDNWSEEDKAKADKTLQWTPTCPTVLWIAWDYLQQLNRMNLEDAALDRDHTFAAQDAEFQKAFLSSLEPTQWGDAGGSHAIRKGSLMDPCLSLTERWRAEMLYERSIGRPVKGWSVSFDTDGEKCIVGSHLNVSSVCGEDWKKRNCVPFYSTITYGMIPEHFVRDESSRWTLSSAKGWVEVPNYRHPKMAPAFRFQAACGLVLSSGEPWEHGKGYTCKACLGKWKPGLGAGRQLTLVSPIQEASLESYVSRTENPQGLPVSSLPGMPVAPLSAASSSEMPSSTRSTSVRTGRNTPFVPYTLINLPDGKRAMAIQCIMPEPPGKEMNAYEKSKMSFQMRFQGSEPLKDVPLDKTLKAHKRIRLEGEVALALWRAVLKHPEGETLRRLDDIARLADERRRRRAAGYRAGPPQ